MILNLEALTNGDDKGFDLCSSLEESQHLVEKLCVCVWGAFRLIAGVKQ